VLFPYFNPVMLSNKGKTYEYGPQVRFKGYPPINLLIPSNVQQDKGAPLEGEAHLWQPKASSRFPLLVVTSPNLLGYPLLPFFQWENMNICLWSMSFFWWVVTYPRYIKIPWIPRDLCSFRALRLKIWMKSPTSADRSEAMPCFVVHGL